MSLVIVLAAGATIGAAMIARSAFGFGHGAFAMPLLVLTLEVTTATPLLGAVSFVMSLYGLAQGWRELRLRAALGLILGALPGIPIGVAALLYLDPKASLLTLAGLLAALSIRGLLGLRLPRLTSDRLGPLFGFMGGVLGGAFNLTGIPVAVFGAMRGWSPADFRMMFNGYFLVTGAVSLSGYVATGLMTAEVGTLFLLCLPPALLGDWLGRRLNQAMSRETFERWIWSLILATSALLIVKQLW